MPLLSVIIPFGLSKERPYIQERVYEKAQYFKTDERIEFIFIEGYSSQEHDLKACILKNNHIYLKDENQKEYFSQGKCRNFGASYANASVLLFLDLDCFISFDSLEKILKLIKIKNILNNPNALLVLPVVYLTQEASEILKEYPMDLWDVLIQEDLISGKNFLVKFFAPSSTSSLIINRHKFLEIGGNNENFIGHGYEDFDLFVRVLNSCLKFEKMPLNLNYDSRNWNFYSFKGFRSWFSLLGYELCFYGIYMYHLWHIEPNQNGYMDKKHKNHKLFYKHLKKIKDYSIDPLQISSVKNTKILVIANKKYNFRALSVYLGKFVYKSLNELAYQNKKEIEIYLQEEKFDKILLDKNIYNEDLHKIFKDYLCVYFESGILPDSWLFYKDANGLYDRKHWDIDLDKLQIKEMQAYITSLKFEEKKKILTFIQKLGFDKDDDLYKIVFYLKNELYSFAKNDGFYQIIFDKKKMLMLGNYDKEYYSLKSFVYKPYLYEIKRVRFFSKILEFLGLNFLLSLISQTKFYRLARKLFFNPRDFFKDSKFYKRHNNAN